MPNVTKKMTQAGLSRRFSETLVVCATREQIDQVSRAFELKAYYCIWGEQLAGRRFGKIIFFHPGNLTDQEGARLTRWKNEVVETKLWPIESTQVFNV